MGTAWAPCLLGSHQREATTHGDGPYFREPCFHLLVHAFCLCLAPSDELPLSAVRTCSLFIPLKSPVRSCASAKYGKLAATTMKRVPTDSLLPLQGNSPPAKRLRAVLVVITGVHRRFARNENPSPRGLDASQRRTNKCSRFNSRVAVYALRGHVPSNPKPPTPLHFSCPLTKEVSTSPTLPRALPSNARSEPKNPTNPLLVHDERGKQRQPATGALSATCYPYLLCQALRPGGPI